MLTQEQIDSHLNNQQTHFIVANQRITKMSDNHLQVYGLMTQGGRILGVSDFLLSVKSLIDINSILLLSFYTRSSVYPNDYEKIIVKDKSWEWVQSTKTHRWESNLNINSYEELDYYILINQKIALMDQILTRIKFYRKTHAELSLGQDLIYVSKYLEAKEIIEKNIINDLTLEYPYASGYANLGNMDLQDAAREILLKWQIQSGFLSETENLRMKYTRIIREETKLENLKSILIAFEQESQLHSAI
jgi:hypothetical protein